MHKERLLNVARALRESPNPDKFTMRQVHTCGSPACAIGHYAARRDLQSVFQLPIKGATYRSRIFGSMDADNLNSWRLRNTLIVGVWGASIERDWMPIVERHFGITRDQAVQLFEYTGCGDARTPNEAAAYIERFVAAN